MAKNALAKSLKGFVVYDVKGELNLKSLLDMDSEERELRRYRIANENEIATIGWLPTIELEADENGEVVTEEEVVTSVNGFNIMKIGQSKKKIPASAVKKKAEELLKQGIEDAKNRGEELKVDKDLKDFYKDEAIKTILPECKNFVDEFESYVIHDTNDERFYVMVPSFKKAEAINGFLRAILTSLPIIPTKTEKDISEALTSFVTVPVNDKITLGSYVKMEGEEGNVVWDKESIYDSEAKSLIEDHMKVVTKLGLNYDGTTDFVVDQDMVISGLKFESFLLSDAGEFKGTFLLIANEVSNLVKELVREINK